MIEEWKNIDGYDGFYQISNFGRVKSVERTITYITTNQSGKEFQTSKYCPERILKTADIRGYEIVSLGKSSKKKTYQVHRLVAEYFIPNQNNYPQVNHKDENKKNNRVDNLEWCTVEYNSNYGTRNQRIAEKLKDNENYYIPVLCYDLNNNFVKRYDSAEQAGQELGISGSGITACCRLYYGRTSAGGFKWKYEKSDNKIEDVLYEPQTKQVHQFDLEGNYIATFESLSDGARALGKIVQNFTKAVKNGLAYGYVWIVGNDYSKIDKMLVELYEKQHHIFQIDDKGNVVNRFKSGLEVEEKLGLNHSNISHSMLSKTKEGKLFRKTGGYYWVDINSDPNYEIDYNYKKGHGETKVVQCDLDGNELMEFDSIADAQEYLGMLRNKISSIYDCFKPNRKKNTAYGYIWIKK
mgnify:CR=1 FL=1